MAESSDASLPPPSSNTPNNTPNNEQHLREAMVAREDMVANAVTFLRHDKVKN